MKKISKDEIKGGRREGTYAKWIASTLDILEGGGTVFVPLSKRNPDFNHEILEDLQSESRKVISMIAQYKQVNDFTPEPFSIGPARQVLTGYKYQITTHA